MKMRNADLSAFLMLILGYFPTGSSINRYLQHYVPVEYNRHDLHRRHVYYNEKSHLEFQFQASERTYHLRLRRASSALTSNFTLYHERHISQPDLSHIYHGYIKDIPGSIVHGAVTDGLFKGSIKVPGESYYVEENSNKSSPYHSIMYSQDDIKWDAIGQFCNDPSSSDTVNPASNHHSTFVHEMFQAQPLKDKSFHSPRTRRASGQPDGTTDSLTKHICTLRLTADHRLWDYMYRKNDKNSGRALNEILFLVESHVTELNTIFGQTVFTTTVGDRALSYKGIQFEIRKVQIFKPEDCKEKDGPLSKAGICQDGLSSELLLAQYSKLFQDEDPFYDYAYDYYENYDTPNYGASAVKERICLNFLVTARVLFASNGNSILGQAYNAQIDRSGGVCFVRDNVGMITILQNTETHELPHMITMNVFTHEVGHSFGAKHDDGKECVSYFTSKEEPEDGFYLMYSVASATRKKNNRIFSNCSTEFVARILSDKYYTECFEDSNVPFCGNNVVEEVEECDCGTNDTCTDTCCYAKGEVEDRPDLDCTFKPKAICSPSQGPCCDGNTCSYINKSSNFVCANKESCTDEIHCDGDKWKALCPPPKQWQIRPDGFVCNENGRVCENGQCNASICKLIGWKECQSFSDAKKLTHDEREELCYIGCQPSRQSACISTHNSADVQANVELMQLLVNLTEEKGKYSVRLPMGTPCNKMTGYCDVFYRCRGVDPDTPLVRLKNCIVTGKCAKKLASFLETYWAGVTLCIIAFIVCFVTFLYCCTVHTKSTNPVLERLHPHRSLRDDIRTVSTIRRSINRSIRRRVTTIRRSFKVRSANLELEDNTLHEQSESSKYIKSDIQEIAPLNTVEENDVEIDVHDSKDVLSDTEELEEHKPLTGDLEAPKPLTGDLEAPVER